MKTLFSLDDKDNKKNMGDYHLMLPLNL